MRFGHYYDSSGPLALKQFAGQYLQVAVFIVEDGTHSSEIRVLQADRGRYYLKSASTHHPYVVVIKDTLTDEKFEIPFRNLRELTFLNTVL